MKHRNSNTKVTKKGGQLHPFISAPIKQLKCFWKKLGTHFGPHQFSIISIKHQAQASKSIVPFYPRVRTTQQKKVLHNTGVKWLLIYVFIYTHSDNTGVKWLLIYVFIYTHSVTYSNTGLVQNCTSKIKSNYKYWLGWSTIK